MSKNGNGFDRYLEFQFRQTGDFFTNLFYAMSHADQENLARLEKGFPEEVEAYKVWTRVGAEEFLARCTQNHPLIAPMRRDLGLDV